MFCLFLDTGVCILVNRINSVICPFFRWLICFRSRLIWAVLCYFEMGDSKNMRQQVETGVGCLQTTSPLFLDLCHPSQKHLSLIQKPPNIVTDNNQKVAVPVRCLQIMSPRFWDLCHPVLETARIIQKPSPKR